MPFTTFHAQYNCMAVKKMLAKNHKYMCTNGTPLRAASFALPTSGAMSTQYIKLTFIHQTTRMRRNEQQKHKLTAVFSVGYFAANVGDILNRFMKPSGIEEPSEIPI
mmetsp:Transcript_130975/g.355456  ORF Transcript_130975/g.355456 Transcript_130975/m.355456 type:complete len:107 (-) Transcript_130975:290-610(-)